MYYVPGIKDDAAKIQLLRLHVEKGLPCGAEDFVHKLGRMIGRTLDFRPQVRPKGGEHE